MLTKNCESVLQVCCFVAFCGGFWQIMSVTQNIERPVYVGPKMAKGTFENIGIVIWWKLREYSNSITVIYLIRL